MLISSLKVTLVANKNSFLKMSIGNQIPFDIPEFILKTNFQQRLKSSLQGYDALTPILLR